MSGVAKACVLAWALTLTLVAVHADRFYGNLFLVAPDGKSGQIYYFNSTHVTLRSREPIAGDFSSFVDFEYVFVIRGTNIGIATATSIIAIDGGYNTTTVDFGADPVAIVSLYHQSNLFTLNSEGLLVAYSMPDLVLGKVRVLAKNDLDLGNVRFSSEHTLHDVTSLYVYADQTIYWIRGSLYEYTEITKWPAPKVEGSYTIDLVIALKEQNTTVKGCSNTSPCVLLIDRAGFYSACRIVDSSPEQPAQFYPLGIEGRILKATFVPAPYRSPDGNGLLVFTVQDETGMISLCTFDLGTQRLARCVEVAVGLNAAYQLR